MTRQEEINKITYNCLQRLSNLVGYYDSLLDTELGKLKDLLEKEDRVIPNPDVFQAFMWKDKLMEILEESSILQCVNIGHANEDYVQYDVVPSGDSNPEVTLSERKFFAFKVPDVAEAQRNPEVMAALLCNPKKCIEEVITHSIIKSWCLEIPVEVAVEDFEENIYYYISQMALKLGESSLELKNIPHERGFLVVSPYIESFLIEDPKFISAHRVANSTMRKGSIGRIAGLDVIPVLLEEEQKFTLFAGYNYATYFLSCLSKIETLRDKDGFSDLVRGLLLYGSKINYPQLITTLKVKV